MDAKKAATEHQPEQQPRKRKNQALARLLRSSRRNETASRVSASLTIHDSSVPRQGCDGELAVSSAAKTQMVAWETHTHTHMRAQGGVRAGSRPDEQRRVRASTLQAKATVQHNQLRAQWQRQGKAGWGRKRMQGKKRTYRHVCRLAEV